MNNPLGNKISEHPVTVGALLGRAFNIGLTLVVAIFAFLAPGNIGGNGKMLYFGLGALFLVVTLFQIVLLVRMLGLRYILYEHGIQRVKGSKTDTWAYTDFNSILASVRVYRLAMLIPIPLFRRYYISVLGNSRKNTLNIGSDFKDMKRMGEFLMTKLPQFSYDAMMSQYRQKQ